MSWLVKDTERKVSLILDNMRHTYIFQAPVAALWEMYLETLLREFHSPSRAPLRLD
jgi:hypothetical protein